MQLFTFIYYKANSVPEIYFDCNVLITKYLFLFISNKCKVLSTEWVKDKKFKIALRRNLLQV
jgi:hypothetical protein